MLVARTISRHHATVLQWRQVPAEHARAVAKLAGLHPSDVRPDLYDPPQPDPGAMIAESVVGPVLPAPRPPRRRERTVKPVAAE